MSRSPIRSSLIVRTSAYPKALELRKISGWGYKRISRFLGLPRSTVHNWVLEKHSPFGSCNAADLRPSSRLSYVAGAFLGDGGLIKSSNYRYELRLRVKDRDFAEHFSACLGPILNKSVETKSDGKGFFVVRVWSRLLFQYLSSWNSIRATVELYPTEFIRGFVDAEGCPGVTVDRSRNCLGLYIVMVNTNRPLLNNIRKFLKARFAIMSTIHLERRRHRMWSKLPCYYLTIGRREHQKRFASEIGFSIARKSEKLICALSLLDQFGPTKAAAEWKKLFEKRGGVWVRRGPDREVSWSPGRDFQRMNIRF